MDNITLLRNFITVTESESIEQAANILSTSISDLVNGLEKLSGLLGHRLFITSDEGKLTLSDKGVSALSMAKALLASDHEWMQNSPNITIRLGMPTDYVSRYLNAMLMEFVRAFTPVYLSIDTDVSGNLLKRLNKGTFDMVIATHWQDREDANKLFDRRFLWVASATGNAHQRQPLPIALYPENCPIRAQVFANHKLNKPPLHIVLSTPSPQALCEVVENDIAVAPIAEFRINERMQILSAEEFGLPELPVFNESIYIGKDCDQTVADTLTNIIMASTDSFGGK